MGQVHRSVVGGALSCCLIVPGASAQSSGGADDPATQAREEFLARLAELAKSAPPPEPARGKRTISGRVMTDVGEPLAGVVIRARREPDPPTTPWVHPILEEPPAESTLAESLQSSVTWWYRSREAVRETTTDADGRFAFDDLLDGQHDLQAFRRGFELTAIPDTYFGRVSVPAGTTVDFVAIPVALQRFDVRMADGTPARDVTMLLERIGRSVSTRTVSWTADHPAIVLSAGDWYVTAMLGGDRVYSTDPRRAHYASGRNLVTIDPKRAPELVSLTLRGVPAIEGRIVLPIPGFQGSVFVTAVRLLPGDEPDPSLLTGFSRTRARRPSPRSEASRHAARTESDSIHGTRYRFDDLAPGRWYVGVAAGEKPEPLVSAVIEVGEECVVHDFVLPPPDPGDRVLVRVLDPDGEPLRDCEFLLFTERVLPDGRSGGSASGGVTVVRTGDGRFGVSKARFQDRNALLATHPRFGSRAIELAGDRQDFTIRFAEPAAVALRMPGYAENARGRNVSIEAEPLGAPDFARKRIWIEAGAIASDGAVDLEKLQPGEWRIRINSDPDPDDSRPGCQVAATTVELAAGAQEVTLPFPALGDVQIVVGAGARVALTLSPFESRPEDGERVRRFGEPDADHIVTFHDVPPGRYEVRGSGNELMFVDAPAEGRLRFTPAPINVLRVTVSDPTGPLARAGLQTGDLVVAIDGREFQDAQQLAWIRQSLKDHEVTLTVERAGELFEVVLARDFMDGRSEAGGRFLDSSR